MAIGVVGVDDRGGQSAVSFVEFGHGIIPRNRRCGVGGVEGVVFVATAAERCNAEATVG